MDQAASGSVLPATLRPWCAVLSFRLSLLVCIVLSVLPFSCRSPLLIHLLALSRSLCLSHLSPLSHSRPGPSMLKKHSDLRTPTRFTEFIFKCVSYDHERGGVSTL